LSRRGGSELTIEPVNAVTVVIGLAAKTKMQRSEDVGASCRRRI
jgi:hypothetical protein